MGRICRIVNERGLHARAAVKFADLAKSFDAYVNVTKDDISACGTSILGLMMLAAGIGSSVVLDARGPQAKAALDALQRFIERGFDDPPQPPKR